MRLRYGHRKLDMIITVYPQTLEFVLKDCRDILPMSHHCPAHAAGLQVAGNDRRIIGHAPAVDILHPEIALKLVPGKTRLYRERRPRSRQKVGGSGSSISRKWEDGWSLST